MTTPALFEAPRAPELKLSEHFAVTANQFGPKYAEYKAVRRTQCEDCVWVVHEARGAGGAAIRSARVKRTWADETVLLCTGHAELWKKREKR